MNKGMIQQLINKLKSMAGSMMGGMAPAIKKTTAPAIKKTTAPAIKKTMAPAIKKTMAPAIKKTMAPVIKKQLPGAKYTEDEATIILNARLYTNIAKNQLSRSKARPGKKRELAKIKKCEKTLDKEVQVIKKTMAPAIKKRFPSIYAKKKAREERKLEKVFDKKNGAAAVAVGGGMATVSERTAAKKYDAKQAAKNKYHAEREAKLGESIRWTKEAKAAMVAVKKAGADDYAAQAAYMAARAETDKLTKRYKAEKAAEKAGNFSHVEKEYAARAVVEKMKKAAAQKPSRVPIETSPRHRPSRRRRRRIGR